MYSFWGAKLYQSIIIIINVYTLRNFHIPWNATVRWDTTVPKIWNLPTLKMFTHFWLFWSIPVYYLVILNMYFSINNIQKVFKRSREVQHFFFDYVLEKYAGKVNFGKSRTRVYFNFFLCSTFMYIPTFSTAQCYFCYI